MERAFKSLNKRNLFDLDGLCVDLLFAFWTACESFFMHWITQLLSSSKSMGELRAKGKIFGKKSADCSINDTRAIVSGSSILRLLDRMLAYRFQCITERICPPFPGCFSGARKFTQPLDIGHALSMFVEKSLDSHSEGAIAQVDVATYYDDLPVLRILKWLEARGVCLTLLTTVCRYQLFVPILVCMGTHSCRIGKRSSGGMTGSVLAVLLSRIPIDSTFAELQSSLDTCGFRVDSGVRLLASAWVDNLYFVSRYASGATLNAELVLRHLSDVWGLRVKPESKQVLIIAGSADRDVVGTGWDLCDTFEVLGWPLQANGGFSLLLSKLQSKMWRSFWCNCRVRGWQRLTLRRRLLLLNRSVHPICRFYLGIVPPGSSYVQKVCRLQRTMTRMLMNLRPDPLESFPRFRSRAARQASTAIERFSSWWARDWIRSSHSWLQHLRRDFVQQMRFINGTSLTCEALTSFSWASLLLEHQSASWLAQRRTFHSSGSRTNTRVAGLGKVNIRWEEAVQASHLVAL